MSGIEDSCRRPFPSIAGPGPVGRCDPLPLPSVRSRAGWGRAQPRPAALPRLPPPLAGARLPDRGLQPPLDARRAELPGLVFFPGVAPARAVAPPPPPTFCVVAVVVLGAAGVECVARVELWNRTVLNTY